MSEGFLENDRYGRRKRDAHDKARPTAVYPQAQGQEGYYLPCLWRPASYRGHRGLQSL